MIFTIQRIDGPGMDAWLGVDISKPREREMMIARLENCINDHPHDDWVPTWKATIEVLLEQV